MARFVYVGLLFVLTLSSIDPVHTQSYSSRVSTLFQDLFRTDDTCLEHAKDKSKEFSKFPQDKQIAVQLVNIYTQECTEYANNDGKKFYANLNQNLRSGHPKPIWKKTGDLLSEGLLLLGSQTFSNVYRACHCISVQQHTSFSFKQFASTTTEPYVAAAFLSSGKSYIHITNVEGTNIQDYSYFGGEKEVLLRPDVNMYVSKVETNISRIREEIRKLVPNKSVPNGVKMFILLDGSRKKRSIRSGGVRSTCDCGSPYTSGSSKYASMHMLPYNIVLHVVIIVGVILQA